jgi:hypothetical protein
MAVLRTITGLESIHVAPTGRTLRLWACKGTHAHCALCAAPIEAPQVEYAVIIGALPDENSPRFHAHCFDEWRSNRSGKLHDSSLQ